MCFTTLCGGLWQTAYLGLFIENGLLMKHIKQGQELELQLAKKAILCTNLYIY